MSEPVRLIKRRRRQDKVEPTDQLSIRATIPDINYFIGWCEENRYTYREGFSKLMQLIGKA